MRRRAQPIDADTRLVRAAAQRVGLSITLAVSVLVIGVLLATLLVVFSQIAPGQLFAPGRHETTVDIDGVDVLIGAIAVGLGAIVLAGTIALLVTRRAVSPLVDALRRQRRFVADASHELRTPLAILDARLQVLQRAVGDDNAHAELICELRDDSRNLNAVVTDLLDSLEVAPAAVAGPVAVGGVVHAAVSTMRMLADERGVDIVAEPVAADVRVLIPEASLHRSLVALLDNAVKHSPPGVVTVTTRADRATATITVADHGPGIQGIAPERVFDRFARSSSAVDGGGNGRAGFGIGLSLVQETVNRYGGSVAVIDTSSNGTAVALTIPRARG